MKYILTTMISMCTLLSVHAQLPDIPDSIFFPKIAFGVDEPDWTYKVEDETKLELVPTQFSTFSISSATGIWEIEAIEENGILYSLYNIVSGWENWGGLLSAIDIATGEEVLYKSYNPDILDPPISPTNMTITSNGNIQILGNRCKFPFDYTFSDFGCPFGVGVPIRMIVDKYTSEVVDTISLSIEDGGTPTAYVNGAPDLIEFVEDSLYMAILHAGNDNVVQATYLLDQNMIPLDTAKYMYGSYNVGTYIHVPNVIRLSDDLAISLLETSERQWSPDRIWAANELTWFTSESEVVNRMRIDSLLVNPIRTQMILREGKLLIAAISLADYGQPERNLSMSLLVLDAMTGEVLQQHPRIEHNGRSYSRGAMTLIPGSDKLLFMGKINDEDEMDILLIENGESTLLKSTSFEIDPVSLVASAESAEIFPLKLFVTEEGHMVAKCNLVVLPAGGEYNIDLGYDLRDVLTSTEEVSEPNTFELYPNPASDYIQLSGATVAEVRLTTMQGQLVRTYRDQNLSRLDVSDLPEGPYVCTIRAEDGSVETHKLMVMR